MPNTVLNPHASEDMKSSVQKFFISQVRDIYWAERYVVKSLPEMKKGAASPELRHAFEIHLQRTREHIARLENIFDLLSEKYAATRCDDMESLVEEGEIFISETENQSAIREIGLIIAAQKIVHYEIASYSGLVQFARLLGLDDVKEILEETLSEEKEMAELLACVMESSVACETSEAMPR